MAAMERIRGHVRCTPLEYSDILSDEVSCPVYLKLESMQVTGSFKPRISFSKLLAMPKEQLARGVVASTAGGHGMGLSYAGRQLGIPVQIFAPRKADARKLAFIRRQGADLHLFDAVGEARTAALEVARAGQKTFISAYNDPDVIAGGGTVGLEIAAALPEASLVLAGVGGGGLISGIGLSMPEAELWGVQPTNSGVLAAWLEAGHPVQFPAQSSMAEGLGGDVEHDSITWPMMRDRVRRIVRVSEEELSNAVRFAFEEHQLVIEPSGAAPIAALRKARPEGHRAIVLIMTGRNIAHERFRSLIA